MVYRIRKKTIFLLGIFFVGVLGFFNNYLRSNYSKDFSLFATKANADVPSCASCGCEYTQLQCDNHEAFGDGDGCCGGGGPSAGDAASDSDGACSCAADGDSP